MERLVEWDESGEQRTRGGKVKDDDWWKEIFRRETDVARSLGQK